MLMLRNLLFQRVRNERGVVSVEWIILAIVIMVAIVAAFAPTFRTALTNGVTAVSNTLTTQSTAASAGGGS